MSIDMSQFFQVFFDETDELLAEMERLLLDVDLDAPDMEDIDAIFRAAHSIKGGAATFGLTDMTGVTHILETLLDMIRKKEIALTSEHVDAFLAAKDVLSMQRDGHRNGDAVDAEAVKNVMERLETLTHHANVQRGVASASAPAASGKPAAAQPAVAKPGEKTNRQLRLELPDVPAKDVEALAVELALLGKLEPIKLADGHSGFMLETAESNDDILAICSFVIDPDKLKIIEPATSTVKDKNANRRVRIELPEIPLKDVDAMAVELALLGKLEQIRQEDGNRGFVLETAESNDDIRAICSFVLDPDKLKIVDEVVSSSGEASNTDDLGYGFFDPLPEPVAQEPDAHKPAEAEKPVTPKPENAAPAVPKPAAKPASRPAVERSAHAQDSSSIRVSVEKVDQLINLVGELVITQAMIEQRSSQLDPMVHDRLLASVNQLTRNTRDLQEAVMSIRMMPMDYVFSRFPRMVRDLAQKLGKKVEFITHGAATELDKGLIERIIDPLTHLVRNSVDHGFEMPDVRRAIGKNEAGKLTLSAAHQGGNIVIEVGDDGGGLNRERILAKAMQNGLPVSDTMPDADVWQLIFAPGFSTAEKVTDVSGRGVGMDVVKRNITSMGGIVDIRSEQSKGTTISISLPLTLAILDGMLIKVGDEVYILPLGFVIESLKPNDADVKVIAGQGKVIKVRGEYLPLIPLYKTFNIEPRYTTPSEGMIVILESDGTKSALFIDEMLGQQQVVVKNLESNYKRVPGVSGATILGDGGVALILDVSAIVRSVKQ